MIVCIINSNVKSKQNHRKIMENVFNTATVAQDNFGRNTKVAKPVTLPIYTYKYTYSFSLFSLSQCLVSFSATSYTSYPHKAGETAVDQRKRPSGGGREYGTRLLRATHSWSTATPATSYDVVIAGSQ